MRRLGALTLLATLVGCGDGGTQPPNGGTSSKVSLMNFGSSASFDSSQMPISISFSFAIKNEDARNIAGLSTLNVTPFGDWKLGCLESPWAVAAGEQSVTLMVGGPSNGGPIHDQFFVGVPCQAVGPTGSVDGWVKGTIAKGQSFELQLTGAFVDGSSFTVSTSGAY